MHLYKQAHTLGLISTLAIACASAHADGLKDMKDALARLQCHTPIKASVDVKSWRKSGEGKDLHETNGQADAVVEDGNHGMQVLFSPTTLSHVEAEARVQAKDPDANAPTLNALQTMNTADLHEMTATTNALLQVTESAIFKEEKADSYNGKPARLLHFEYPADALGKRAAKYVKKFDMNFDVWISSDGTPLASRMTQNASGRAMLVISFEQKSSQECVYGLVGDRLFTVRKIETESGSGGGEKSESRTIKNLQVQS